MQELISNFLFVGTGLAFTLKLLIGGLLLGVSLGDYCQYSDIIRSVFH